MKKILITTNHPAPYINEWCDLIEAGGYSLSIIYKYRKASYKQWKNFKGRDGKYYGQINIFSFLHEYRKVDLALLGGWDNLFCLVSILLSPFFNTRCAVYSDHPSYYVKKNFQYYFKKYVILRLVDYIFCATESTCAFYQKHYKIKPSKTIFFPYSYNDAFNDENKRINKERVEALNIDNEPIRVFLANNFYSRKGYDIVVDVLREMAKRDNKKKFKFIISGTGELWEAISQQINEMGLDVKVLGWIESADYVRYMNNCDVFLHASKFEPFGIPPLDALSRGKLLISTRGVESISSLIENGVNGYIYDPDNAEELFSILMMLNKKEIYNIGERGRKSVLQKYGSHVFVDALSKIFACNTIS